MIAGEARERAQPLLSPLYYVQRALSPYAEVVSAKGSNIADSVSELLQRQLSVLILADIGKLVSGSLDAIESWVERGGTLVRFAGPRLEQTAGRLLPGALRRGGRTLGGSLSWSTPQQLAAFDDTSPFYGLTPPRDVTIRRQVLSDPAAGRQAKVWARLKDGTPLVSAARRGDGWLVLFHITANSDWSNLPMSGLFVEMLRRITERSVMTSAEAKASPGGQTLSAGATQQTGLLTPRQVLDGFGRLVAPSPALAPIEAGKFAAAKAGPAPPPGSYGPGRPARARNLIRRATGRAANVVRQVALVLPLCHLFDEAAIRPRERLLDAAGEVRVCRVRVFVDREDVVRVDRDSELALAEREQPAQR